MTVRAGRRRRRSEGSRRIASERRIGGLIRWQAAPRRAGGAWPDLWAAVTGAAVLLTLALIAARTAGWLHWGNLLLLVPAGMLVVAFGAGLPGVVRRAAAWLAG